MIGAICTTDLLAHPAVTIRCFGWRVFFRALFSAREATFLSLLQQAHAFDAAGSDLPEVLKRCVRLEREAMRTYDTLAHRFIDTPEIHILFAHLAEQEREHAELLQVCARAAKPGAWRGATFGRLAECLPGVEERIEQVRASLGEVTTVREALAFVIALESSEINRIFAEILKAADSPFVKRLRPFRKSVCRHVTFICRHVTRIEPELAPACDALRAASRG